ncbi:MAG: hypothetical protein RBG13Loki_0357 [Promethearchaeota archaeon CR_4]|nr:MAG: hypothetical protein RBG13Loki_0357 [Candidatus Lokiarchaeota archaeon CR_4]
MNPNIVEGKESHLYPEERMVPMYDWLEYFLKVAQRLEQEHPLKFSVEGNQYSRLDYWQGLAYKVMTQQPMKAALDELDKFLFERDHPGEEPRLLGGVPERHARVVPHKSQMDDFVRHLPKAFKAKMTEEIFHAFCTTALELGLVEKTIYVLIDYTHEWFYGEVCPQNEAELTGSNKGPGTKWGRKYGALMLSSGTTRLFCGLFLSKKGHSKVPDILQAIDLLKSWGFSIEHVTGDREISCYDVMSSLLAQGTFYLGSIKRLPKEVKKAIKAYLAGTGKSVVAITLHPTPTCQYDNGLLQCYLILKPDRGKRVGDLQAEIAAGTLTEKKAMEHVHAFVTTMRAPRNKRRWASWGLGLVRRFSKRWRIETGFRDIRRHVPASRARNAATKTLLVAFQMFAYDCWQLQRALHRKLRRVPKAWRVGPTLERFCSRIEDQVRVGACTI